MSQPSTIDLVTPFDPTSYTRISGAQLEQLVAGAAPYSDKGLIIVTSDVAGIPEVPSADLETKWQNYMWIRRTATSAVPYVWDTSAANHTDGSGNDIKKWYTVAIATLGTGAVTTNMIANGAITDIKVSDINYSKLTGAPDSLPPSGDAGGALDGTYPKPSLADNAVTTGKIADKNVTNYKLQDVDGVLYTTTGLVLSEKVRPSTVGEAIARTNAGATATEWKASPSIIKAVSPVKAESPNLGRIPQVATEAASDGGTWKMVAPTTLGRILQVASIVTAITPISPATLALGQISGTNSTQIPELKISNFKPVNVASTLLVKVSLMFSKTVTDGDVAIALFKVATGVAYAAAGNAVAAITTHCQANNSERQLFLSYKVSTGSTDAVDFMVGAVKENGTVSIGSAAGYTPASQQSIEVIEYL